MAFRTDPFAKHAYQVLEQAVELGLDDRIRDLLMARFCRAAHEHGPAQRRDRALNALNDLNTRIAILQAERDVILGWINRIPDPKILERKCSRKR